MVEKVHLLRPKSKQKVAKLKKNIVTTELTAYPKLIWTKPGPKEMKLFGIMLLSYSLLGLFQNEKCKSKHNNRIICSTHNWVTIHKKTKVMQ